MNRIKRAAALVLAALLCLTLLSACSEVKEKGLSLSVCVGATPATLDPIMATEPGDQTILEQLYENLMRVSVDTSGKTSAVNGVAKSVDEDKNSDGTVTYTFRLRKVQWSDGKDLTAGDFVYAWRRLANPLSQSPNARLLSVVKGYDTVRAGGDLSALAVTAKNSSTLVVTLKGKYDWFLTDVCTAAATMPLREDVVKRLKTAAEQKNQEAEKAGQVGENRWWTDAASLVTDGAYTVSEYVPGTSLTTAASASYYGTLNGPSEIRYRFAESAEDAWSLYKNKEVDFVSPLPEERLAELAKDDMWSPAPGLATYTILFNTAAEPLNDPLMRQALSLSLDRNALAKLAGAAARPATGLVPYGVPGSGEEDFRTAGGDLIDCTQEHYGDNCATAKKQLTQAGYDSGRSVQTMELLYVEDGTAGQVLQAAVKMWSSVLQVSVTLRSVTESELKEALAKGSYVMAAMDPIAMADDAESFLIPFGTHSADNVTGYSNSAFDTLLSIIGSASDSAARLACLHDAESLLLEDGAIAPVYFPGNDWELRDSLTGVCRDARGWYSFTGVHQRTA